MRNRFHAGLVRIHATPFLLTVLLSTPFLLTLLGCDLLPRAGDTAGSQRSARWDQFGRLVIDADSSLTVVRLRSETLGVAQRHDVVLARFEFDPAEHFGDEYALIVALEFGDVRRLRPGGTYTLATPPAAGDIVAHATVTCVCRPLRPDSVTGTYHHVSSGLRQLTGRLDATLHFTAWDDSTHHATYRLQQTIYGVRP